MGRDEKSSFSEIASVVPQIFYDIIARIIPGIILIFLFSAVFDVNKIKSYIDLFTPIFSGLLTGCVAAYFISTVLGQLYNSVMELVRKPDYDNIKNISYMYDFIKHKDPVTGARITKLKAENEMTKVLIAGFFLIVLVNSFGLTRNINHTANYIILSISLPGLIGSIEGSRYFNKRIKSALENCYEVLDGPPELKDGTLMYKTKSADKIQQQGKV